MSNYNFSGSSAGGQGGHNINNNNNKNDIGSSSYNDAHANLVDPNDPLQQRQLMYLQQVMQQRQESTLTGDTAQTSASNAVHGVPGAGAGAVGYSVGQQQHAAPTGSNHRTPSQSKTPSSLAPGMKHHTPGAPGMKHHTPGAPGMNHHTPGASSTRQTGQTAPILDAAQKSFSSHDATSHQQTTEKDNTSLQPPKAAAEPGTPGATPGTIPGNTPGGTPGENAQGLSMTIAAIRARARRKREREEREQLKAQGIHVPTASSAPSPSSAPAIQTPKPPKPHKTPSSKSAKKGPPVKKFDLSDMFSNLNGDPDNYFGNVEATDLAKRLTQLRKENLKGKRPKGKKEISKEQAKAAPLNTGSTASTTPMAPISSLKGPDALVGTQIPPSFPREEVFRAMTLYSAIRTLSFPLRLSPFTPTTFLRGLAMPVMNRLIGEIHVSLLKTLFVELGRGADFYRLSTSLMSEELRPKKVGSGVVDSDDVMGSDCLTYMNESTWPLFYVDYVEATQDKFAVLEEIPTELNKVHLDVTPVTGEVMYRSRPAKKAQESSSEEESDDEVIELSEGETESDDDQTVSQSTHPDPRSYGNDSPHAFAPPPNRLPPQQTIVARVPAAPVVDMKETLLDLVLKIRRKADVYGFFSRPVDPVQDQCPDYFEVIDPVNEAMDLGTIEKLIKSGQIDTFDKTQTYLKRIVTSGRKYNTDTDNFVRKQTERFDTMSISLVQKAREAVQSGEAVTTSTRAPETRGGLPLLTNKRKFATTGPANAPSFAAPTFSNNVQLERKGRTSTAIASVHIQEQVQSTGQAGEYDRLELERPTKQVKLIEGVSF
jgi:hypothetical protein